MKLYASRTQLILLLITFIAICEISGQQHNNDPCRIGKGNGRGRGRGLGSAGVCVFMHRCLHAMQELERGVPPQLCGFEGLNTEPVVCCPRNSPIIQENTSNPPVIEPPSPPGTKSKQKCLEYTNKKVQEKLMLVPAVVGGVEVTPKEFPHMAALGFGSADDIQWLCGGTLISEEYVLTAGHCLYAQQYGDVKYIRLGDHNLKSTTDVAEPQDFEVASAISHPEYMPPSQYNDIGLIKLNRPIEFTQYVKPACMHANFELPQDLTPIATGWGKLAYTGDSSDVLMKVDLSYFTLERCQKTYTNVPQRQLPNGIDGKTQICAGGMNVSKDTCQGDSGGPLQVKTQDKPNKQFYVIGVTSFGKACGIVNTPGVYTRVSNYIPWIEEVVWPNA